MTVINVPRQREFLLLFGGRHVFLHSGGGGVLLEGLKRRLKLSGKPLVASGQRRVDRGQEFIQVCLGHVVSPFGVAIQSAPNGALSAATRRVR